MSRMKTMIVAGALGLLLLGGCGPKNGPSSPRGDEGDAGVIAPVLPRFEKYEVPAMPRTKGVTKEIYDLRKEAGAPVPSSVMSLSMTTDSEYVPGRTRISSPS